METLHGWPVVTAKNCFDVIRGRGIVPWPKVSELSMDAFLQSTDDAGRNEFARFGPKVSVGQYHDPHNNNRPFNGFRTAPKPCAMVFALIDECVPVTAEWKHGNERITLCPPAGVPGKQEAGIDNVVERFHSTAMREWTEETGTTLESATLLSPASGIWASVRTVNLPYYPFLGVVKEPCEKGPTKFDESETLQMLLFPLREWLGLIENYALWDANPEFGLEVYSREITYAALRQMGRLRYFG